MVGAMDRQVGHGEAKPWSGVNITDCEVDQVSKGFSKSTLLISHHDQDWFDIIWIYDYAV